MTQDSDEPEFSAQKQPLNRSQKTRRSAMADRPLNTSSSLKKAAIQKGAQRAQKTNPPSCATFLRAR